VFVTYNGFTANTLRYAVTVAFDSLILNVCRGYSISAVTWWTAQWTVKL